MKIYYLIIHYGVNYVLCTAISYTRIQTATVKMLLDWRSKCTKKDCLYPILFSDQFVQEVLAVKFIHYSMILIIHFKFQYHIDSSDLAGKFVFNVYGVIRAMTNSTSLIEALRQ